jgi:hypothetical protein
MQAPPSGVGASSDASAPLENELREIVTKLQQSFTQLIHQNASIVRRQRSTATAQQRSRLTATQVNRPCALSLTSA